mmetsp:Transcript_93850/g.271246  ORF Transcript_93850/g.271246 Transcript_93850/m.271246 type:complete len:270 (+) Transcript_93850:396-1205(+)
MGGGERQLRCEVRLALRRPTSGDLRPPLRVQRRGFRRRIDCRPVGLAPRVAGRLRRECGGPLEVGLRPWRRGLRQPGVAVLLAAQCGGAGRRAANRREVSELPRGEVYVGEALHFRLGGVGAGTSGGGARAHARGQGHLARDLDAPGRQRVRPVAPQRRDRHYGGCGLHEGYDLRNGAHRPLQPHEAHGEVQQEEPRDRRLAHLRHRLGGPGDSLVRRRSGVPPLPPERFRQREVAFRQALLPHPQPRRWRLLGWLLPQPCPAVLPQGR